MPSDRGDDMRRYLGAFIATGVALLVRLAFVRVLGGDRAPYFPFVLAVLAAAGYGGLGPGLVATVLGTVVGTLLFVPPWEWINEPNGAFITLLFVVIGTTASALCGALHRARMRTEDKQRELERMQSQLRDADRRKDEFLATLAHELRNPLAPVQNAVGLLQSPEASENDIQLAREIIDRQVKHLSRLVDDLLDVSRITSGKLVLRKERLSLETVLSTAIESSQPLIDARKHELTVIFSPERLEVDGDSVRLTQVFANLLNNAAKFTPPRGRIWLSVARESNEAVVRVRDDGVGIPKEMRPHIFDMFMQVDHSLERSASGLGLGLSLAHRLVQMHDGRIEVDSDGSQQGSEFIVRLPLCRTEPQSIRLPAIAAAPAEAAVPTRALRVLVVDDNKDAARSLVAMLRLKGHDTYVASDGLAAVEVARSVEPEVVILDIGLPVLNGYDAARRIRRLKNGNLVLLIALTGWGQAEDKQLAIDAGFDHHLTKPVDGATIDDLLAERAESAAV